MKKTDLVVLRGMVAERWEEVKKQAEAATAKKDKRRLEKISATLKPVEK